MWPNTLQPIYNLPLVSNYPGVDGAVMAGLMLSLRGDEQNRFPDVRL